MKVLWGSHVYADETADVSWIWKNCYFPRLNRAEIRAVFFVRQGIRMNASKKPTPNGDTAPKRSERRSRRPGYADTHLRLPDVNRPQRSSMRLAVVAQKNYKRLAMDHL